MNLPIQFNERMKNMLGSDFEKFINSYNQPHTYSLRLNNNKNTSFLQDIYQDKVEWTNNAYYYSENQHPGKSIYHDMGLYYIQESSAMIPVEVLNPKENEIVLDLCAAPGGKTTQILDKMHNTGLLISNEIIAKRANILKDNISRLGFTNSIVLNENVETISNRFNDYFDKILVDAPCSGEGMFRKNPEAIQEWSVDNVNMCAERQLNILNTIKNCLKENGILVYSTCTFSPQENEQVIEKLLKENKDLKLLEITIQNLTDGLIQNTINNFEEIQKTKRIFPHINRGEGHFVAKLVKTSSSTNSFNDIKLQKTSINSKALKLYKDFEKKYLNKELKGTFLQFGDNIYILPNNSPALKNLKVVYSGLLLGRITNNRFEPSHEFALSLKTEDYKNCIHLSESQSLSYTQGNTLNINDENIKDWTLLLYNNNPIGWGKTNNGIIKNHYPKYLRR